MADETTVTNTRPCLYSPNGSDERYPQGATFEVSDDECSQHDFLVPTERSSGEGRGGGDEE